MKARKGGGRLKGEGVEGEGALRPFALFSDKSFCSKIFSLFRLLQ